MRPWLARILPTLLLVSSLQAGGGGRVETLGGPRDSGLAQWGEEVVLDDGTTIPQADFLAWEAAIESPPLPGELWVERADGVAFRALPLAWGPEGVSLDSSRLGTLSLPYERISRILFLDRLPSTLMRSRLFARMSLAGPQSEDVLWLEKDQIQGIFDSIAGDKLKFESKGAMMDIPMSSVHALAFPTPRASPALILTTRDGFCLPVTSLDRPEGDHWLVVSPAGEYRFKPSEISRLEAHPAHHHFLPDLKPVEVREGLPGVAEFPGAYRWPHRVNAAVHSGSALRVRGQEVLKGLGVHADSLLAYDLPKGSLELSGSCALDDEAQGLGSAHFIIRGDGKVMFESGLMTGREAPRHFRLDLKGLRRLELEVVTDPGGAIKDYTLDRCAWIGLILVGS
ncbi:MAG: NPCBM/NEW2 domain-containing protein [Planctomycetota bacterium]